MTGVSLSLSLARARARSHSLTHSAVSFHFVGVSVIESRAQRAKKFFDVLSLSLKRSRHGKRGSRANVTNGAPENGVLERYERGRFAVVAFSDLE